MHCDTLYVIRPQKCVSMRRTSTHLSLLTARDELTAPLEGGESGQESRGDGASRPGPGRVSTRGRRTARRASRSGWPR